jgi:hypothetical protein
VSPTPTPRDVVFFTSPDELRDWFDAHHETAAELWVGYHRKATGRPTVSWPQAVDEALCVGWIDGVRYRLDDERHAQRFTPRRKGSIWSVINTRRAAELIAEGRMRPAGLKAFEARSPEKTALYSYEREAAAFTKGQQATLRGGRGGVEVLPGAGAVISAEHHPLGFERQTRRDAGAAVREAAGALARGPADRRAGMTYQSRRGRNLEPDCCGRVAVAVRPG